MKNFPGVFTAQKKDGTIYYRSSITYRAKHISLGSYSTPEQAHCAYLEAQELLLSSRKLLPADYNNKITYLPFVKWIVLINFKNNGIYIKTPIYLHQNFFQYYLSPDDVLTFDTDDLFYYSQHTIQRRGGHLFVSDYGMQVNILSRYGIKNFAVAGKDFRFVNADTSDFRYANLQIINPYHGVSRMKEGAAIYYLAKIHIRGDYIIGRYKTAVEAAIAYNKAADLLKQKGITKNFPQNYIEDLNASDYANIYSSLTVSDKILQYPSVSSK